MYEDMVYYSKEYKTLYSKWPSEKKVEDKIFLMSLGEVKHDISDEKDMQI